MATKSLTEILPELHQDVPTELMVSGYAVARMAVYILNEQPDSRFNIFDVDAMDEAFGLQDKFNQATGGESSFGQINRLFERASAAAHMLTAQEVSTVQLVMPSEFLHLHPDHIAAMQPYFMPHQTEV